MAIHIDLQRIATNKPAGDYFLYYDRSLVPANIAASGLRIIVGQSKVGVVNALTYHDKWESFKAVYGDIDRTLERNGSFFHRSAFIMLNAGTAIAAVNLRAFDDTLDKATKLQLATATNENNTANVEVPFTSLFDRERFWKVDPAAVVNTANLDNLLSISNVGSRKLSIFIKRAENVDIKETIDSYYKNTLQKSVPTELYKFDKVSDTFVDVYVFANDFATAADNMSNSSYGHLFDLNGLKRVTTGTLSEATSGLVQLSNISEAGFVKKYTGSLISDLTDSSANSLFICNAINADFSTVGLVAGINTEIVDNAARWYPTTDVDDKIVLASNGGKQPTYIDNVGHNLFVTMADASIDEASYNGQTVNSLSYDGNVTTKLINLDYSNIYTAGLDSIENTAIKIENPLLFGKSTIVGANTVYTVADKSKAYLFGINKLKVGDKYVAEDSNLATLQKLEFKGTKKMLLNKQTSVLAFQASGDLFPVDLNGNFIYPIGHTEVGELVEFSTVTGEPLTRPLLDGGVAIPMPTLTAPQLTAALLLYGTVVNVYLASFDRPLAAGVTTAISSLTALPEMTITLDDSTELSVYTSAVTSLYVQKDIDALTVSYKPFVLKSYKQRQEQFVNNTSTRQDEVLNVLSSALLNGFKDRERLDFRYLVDTFKGYIGNNCKEQFGVVIKGRGVGAAILNPPSIKEFKQSTNPYFKETANGTFEARFVFEGGNLELPYTKTFSLVSQGANHCYFYGPYFNFNDNGNTIIIPPAAAVSNNFSAKALSAKPYDAVFGPDNGKISAFGITGLEYDFTEDDRSFMERSGINPIVFKKAAGNIVMGNRTALLSNSALKFAHVNELMVSLYEQMRPIAIYLIGKYNTEAERLVAKVRMDSITTPMLSSGALQYAENIVDRSNNTEEVISEGMAVMDTVFVPGYINEKVVYRLIANRTTSEVTSQIL